MEKSRIVKSCFSVFEAVNLLLYKLGRIGLKGFHCGTDEEVFREGFSLFTDCGFSYDARIIGAPCGIDEMTNYAIVDINKGSDEPPHVVILHFPD